MRFGRACLVALLLAFGFALRLHDRRVPRALDDALAHFTADDFSETDAGINAVAASGNPRAETILRALQDGQLDVQRRAARRSTSRTTPASCSMPPPAQPIAGDAPADLDNVRINNRLRGAIDAALGGLTLLSRRSGKRVRRGAGGVQVARGERAADARKRASPRRQDARVKRALTQARAAIVLIGDDASDADKLAAVAVIRAARRPGRAGAALEPAGRHRRAGR